MRRWITTALALLAWHAPALAQTASAPVGLVAGESAENALRDLQLLGIAPLHPWSVRGFSAVELARLVPDSVPAWAAASLASATGPALGPFELLPLRTWAAYHGRVPVEQMEGPIWAGRGLTTAVRAGVRLRAGPLSAQVAPVAFRAQNEAFELEPTGLEGMGAYRHPHLPTVIDLPQRFGDAPYARLDPGETWVRLDTRWLTAGASSARQQWGPAGRFAAILSDNAPGFPHAFAGPGAPIPLPVGHLHGRVIWGRLTQSPYSPVESGSGVRFASGLTVVFVPRVAPGLELGVARFFHEVWPAGGPGVAELLKPFEGFLKVRLTDGESPGGWDPDNQLASAFARWVLPGSGFELYGELARNDHNWDLRDFLMQPDHDSSYMLGFRKLWSRGGAVVALQGDLVNARLTHLQRVRPQVEFYRHAVQRQGHTQNGQLLGSHPLLGGTGHALTLERTDARRTIGISWTRHQVSDRGDAWATPSRVEPRIGSLHALAVHGALRTGGTEVEGSLGLEALVHLGEPASHGLTSALRVRAGGRGGR